MTSLIAQFFRKNVSLNMRATAEDRPQTVKGETRIDLGEGWNLPRGSTMPLVPQGEPYPGKKEEKNSLIAKFFRRNVTLNNDAKYEKSPQTVYTKPYVGSMWNWSWSAPFLNDDSDGLYRKYVEGVLSSPFSDPYLDGSRDRAYINTKCDVYEDNGNIVVSVSLSQKRCTVSVDKRAIDTIGIQRIINTVSYQAIESLSATGTEVKAINEAIDYEMMKYFNSRGYKLGYNKKQ